MHSLCYSLGHSLWPATASWSQPRALQSHKEAFPTHLSMATSWESAKKSLIMKTNPGMKPVVLWVQSPLLLPAGFGCPALWPSHCRGWVSVTLTNKVPVSHISSITTWNAAEPLLTQAHSCEHLPLGSTKRFPTMAWSSWETGLLSCPFQTPRLTTSNVRGE